MTNPNCWYALQLRHKCEHLARLALEHKGYEVFLPIWEEQRSSNPNPAEPLFPGYIFVRLGTNCSAKAIATPSVIRIVSFGGVAAEVSVNELDNIRKVIKSHRQARPWKRIPPGTRVRIETGPLKGAEGGLAVQDDNRHLVVTVNILNRSVSVMLDARTEVCVLEEAREAALRARS